MRYSRNGIEQQILVFIESREVKLVAARNTWPNNNAPIIIPMNITLTVCAIHHKKNIVECIAQKLGCP